MYTQSFVVEVLAYEHGKDLLKKADAHRLMCQVKRQQSQASCLKRAVMHSHLLLREHVRQAADQALLHANGALPAAKRK